MPKTKDDYTNLDVMLPQGARSRHVKAMKAIDAADDLMPVDALDGTSAELRQAIKHLQSATENIAEMIVYRKIMGVD